MTDRTAREIADTLDINDHVFAWFNERHPDEMQQCLDAYDEATRLLEQETPSP